MLFQLANLVVNTAYGLGIADVVRLDVRLGEQGIIEGELRIEADGTLRRKKQVFLFVVAGIHMVSHKAPKARDYDTVVAQKEDFYMSFEFNHYLQSYG